MNRAIELLEREIGVRAERDLRPAHPADMPRNWASIERAARDLGYAPSVDLDEGRLRDGEVGHVGERAPGRGLRTSPRFHCPNAVVDSLVM